MYVRAVVMGRKAMKDITLRDGTRIPRGTLVQVASYALHHDGSRLVNADTFDAFRYARMRGGTGQSLKYQFTSTSPEYVSFGHGQHSWCVVPRTPLPAPYDFVQPSADTGIRNRYVSLARGGTLRRTS